MTLHYANLWSSTLTGAITSGATSATVVSTTGSPDVPFVARIKAEGANKDELVTVTAKSGSLTITRATEAIGDGTQVAQAHASGATVEAVLTAALLDQIIASGAGLADQGVITYLDGTVAAAPATPASGKLRIYAKTGKVLAVLDDTGAETILGAAGAAAITTKDEGTTLSTGVTTINFVGAGVTASGAGATTTVTIPGGAFSPLVLYAECVTPPTGTASLSWTFKDEAQSAISGAPLTAALAAMGLTYVGGTFTATMRIVILLGVNFTVAATPGGADNVIVNNPGWDYDVPIAYIPSPNTLGKVSLSKHFVANVSGQFGIQQSCANGSDHPFTYASMNIIRIA
jgi:hypothetical protein